MAELFSFNRGDFTAATWQSFLDSIPNDSVTGRSRPDSNSYTIAASKPDTYLSAVVNDEVPFLVGGDFHALVHTGSHDDHNQLRAVTPDFDDSWYLKKGVLYRFELAFELRDSVGWASEIVWGIPFQVWGQYSSDWRDGQHPINPPFALIAQSHGGDLQLRAQAYGTSSPSATDWEYSGGASRAIELGSHTATVWWRKDETGANSYCQVELDGAPLFTATNVKLGTPFDTNGGLGVPTGGLPQFGMYTPRIFASPGVECFFSKYEIHQEFGLPAAAAATDVSLIRGRWLIDQGVAKKWAPVDAFVRSFWPADTRGLTLNDEEARPGTPHPYVVYESADPLILGHSGGSESENEQQYQDVPIQFRVHAKSRDDAKAVAEQIKAVYDSGTDLLDLYPDCHLCTISSADFHVREGDEEWLWVVEYAIRLDATYNAGRG